MKTKTNELEVPETFEFMGMILPTYPNKTI